MTTAQLHHPSTGSVGSDRSTFGWGWAVLSAAAFALAFGVAYLNSATCSDAGACSPTLAGGPIGWFAVGSLLVQSAWAAVIAVRPPRED
ncbi:MAG: hypothetical protein L0G22_07465 [Propionibacteriaceae bacterium]|nr:hypothetical protein [Propionibacteriaceae bacterium]